MINEGFIEENSFSIKSWKYTLEIFIDIFNESLIAWIRISPSFSYKIEEGGIRTTY